MNPLTLALLFPIRGYIEIIPNRSRTTIRTKDYAISIPIKADGYLRYSRKTLYKKLGRLKERRFEALKALEAIAKALARSKKRYDVFKAYTLVVRIYRIRRGRFRKELRKLLVEVTKRFLEVGGRLCERAYKAYLAALGSTSKLKSLFGGIIRGVARIIGAIGRLRG